ncbi:MAG: DUF192 domain-containing protein [Myxococcales bacterium]|nr:MAG: DUF192 domain-containing protein [Myxococcales bacterium]
MSVVRPLPTARIFAAVASALVSAAACNSGSSPHVVLTSADGAIPVEVELALTREDQARGLMYRESMPENHGMLFVFADNQDRSFWMKNTPLPLDIIYIGEDARIVSIAQNTTPYSTRAIPSRAPARYVLEVNGGFCRRRGIKVGSEVDLPALPEGSTERGPDS